MPKKYFTWPNTNPIPLHRKYSDFTQEFTTTELTLKTSPSKMLTASSSMKNQTEDILIHRTAVEYFQDTKTSPIWIWEERKGGTQCQRLQSMAVKQNIKKIYTLFQKNLIHILFQEPFSDFGKMSMVDFCSKIFKFDFFAITHERWTFCPKHQERREDLWLFAESALWYWVEWRTWTFHSFRWWMNKVLFLNKLNIYSNFIHFLFIPEMGFSL